MVDDTEDPGTVITVRRAIDPAEARTTGRLAEAIQRSDVDRVVVADAGPIYEDDFRFRRGGLELVAAAGTRPIIYVREPSNDLLRARQAAIVLEPEDRLVVEGIDFVVPVASGGSPYQALFACEAGSTLILRDCTINVAGVPASDWAAFHMEPASRPTASRPDPPNTRVLFERSFLRGPSQAGFDLMGLGAEVRIERSTLVTGPQPVVRLIGAEGGFRNRLRAEKEQFADITLLRSVLASEGPQIRFLGVSESRLPETVLQLHTFGSILARIGQRGGDVCWLDWNDRFSTDPWSYLLWLEADSRYLGWDALASAGSQAITTLDRARSRFDFGESAQGSVALSGASWPEDLFRNPVVPDQIRSVAPQAAPILARSATPRPLVYNLALGPLRLMTTQVGDVLGRDHGIPAQQELSGSSGERVLGLRFEVEPGTPIDLGQRLSESLLPGRPLIHVEITGQGEVSFSPIRVPRGTVLAIHSDPELRLVPNESAATGSDTPLILAEGADLVLTGVHFDAGTWCQSRPLIEIREGHLSAAHCQLVGTGLDRAGVDTPLIRWSDPSTRPYTPGRAIVADCPVLHLDRCFLKHAGRVVQAELGRGLIEARGSIVVAGRVGFDLVPAQVVRERFQADLRLRRVTLASLGAFIRINEWTGTNPGPNRPWLIDSETSVYIDNFQSQNENSLLLEYPEDAQAAGLVLWQSRQDAYMLTRFLASTWPISETRSPFLDFPHWKHVWNPWSNSGELGPDRGRFPIEIGFTRGFLIPGRIEVDQLRLTTPRGDAGRIPRGADPSDITRVDPLDRSSAGSNRTPPPPPTRSPSTGRSRQNLPSTSRPF